MTVDYVEYTKVRIKPPEISVAIYYGYQVTELQITSQLTKRQVGVLSWGVSRQLNRHARLAQSVEHQTFNLRVAGSSPSSGVNVF